MSIETFDPIANGWKIQRDFKPRRVPIVAVDTMELGNKESIAIADRQLRTVALELRTGPPEDSRAAYEYLMDFFDRHKGPAGRFYFSWLDFIPSPGAGPALEANAGGALSQRDYLIAFSWKTASGETRASPSSSLTIPANNLCKVSIRQFPANVSQCRIYGTAGAAGTEVLQTTLTDEREWTEPSSGLLTGTAAPPAANSATETILAMFSDVPFEPTRGAGLTWQANVTLEEVYS